MRVMNASGLMQPVYHGDFFRSCQERLDAAVERGITRENWKRSSSGCIRIGKTINTGHSAGQHATLESGILKPRQTCMYSSSTTDPLSVPPLDERAASVYSSSVWGAFSAYSNIGVRTVPTPTSIRPGRFRSGSCGKASDSCGSGTRADDLGPVHHRRANSSFTVLRIRDIRARLAHRNRKTKLGASLFYKGNSGSLFIIHNNSDIHTAILDEVSPLPGHLIFENFLGSNPAKPGYLRLKNDEVPLSIISDATLESEPAGSLIGSRSFLQACRQLAGIHPDLFPQQWIFSMKYSINRAYDYVSAMVHAGYSLREIGFTGSRDPDYVFLGQAHRLMLFLQELIHIKLDSYTNLCDYSYISADRFAGFMDPPKGFFRRDFDAMVLSPHFLLASQRQRYSFYAKSIHDKKEIILRLPIPRWNRW